MSAKRLQLLAQDLAVEVDELREQRKDLLAALQGMLDDFQQMLSDPELLKMAMELARSGRPLDFESDGGPDTVRQARAAIARAVEVKS